MDGIHLFGEWFDCPADIPELVLADSLRRACLAATAAAGLTAVGERFHQFKPQGVTGTILLAESHLAIHTWPEDRFASVDVFVCNFTADNRARAHLLFDNLRTVLQPARVSEYSIQRGGRVPTRRIALEDPHERAQANP